jgi:hypothetical protein
MLYDKEISDSQQEQYTSLRDRRKEWRRRSIRRDNLQRVQKYSCVGTGEVCLMTKLFMNIIFVSVTIGLALWLLTCLLDIIERL